MSLREVLDEAISFSVIPEKAGIHYYFLPVRHSLASAEACRRIVIYSNIKA